MARPFLLSAGTNELSLGDFLSRVALDRALHVETAVFKQQEATQ
jgi:hypothetical protein